MPLSGPVSAAEFAACMDALGPFEPNPTVAVAVSGGADSLALALLAREWAAARGGSLLALVIDHGLRPAAAQEAAATVERLRAAAIASVSRRLDLPHGAGLAARAREARYWTLQAICRERGIIHLLVGHHAADQAETVLMRALSHSAAAGEAGIAAVRELRHVRLLRPLLGVPPDRLRATARAAGVGWVEDPSNADPAALRPRLRGLRLDRGGGGAATSALLVAALGSGGARRLREDATARALAASASIRPEGFAVLRPGPIDATALAALVRTIGGAANAPPRLAIERLAAALGPATLAGARITPAGRLGPGLLMLREEAAMRGAVRAEPDALWDGRFRVVPPARELAENPSSGEPVVLGPLVVGALGSDAPTLRQWSSLPSAVLRTLPAFRRAGVVVCVPHIGFPDAATCAALPRLQFSPIFAAACAPFFITP